jgi:small-conductance mechanosensitive channel
MAKILLIVAIVVSVATAFLGYLNHQTLRDAKADAATSQHNADKAVADQKKAAAELETAKKEAADAVSGKEELVTAANNARQQAEQAQKDLDAAKLDAADKEQQLAAALAENEQLKASPTAGATPMATPGEPDQMEVLNATIESLRTKVEEANAQVETLSREKQDRQARRMREGLEGRILAVNPSWNFVVLSVGDRNGVVNNAEMLVKRGGQLLGKVRITSVEPSTSIADIVANSVPSGLTIQPGDSVIYTSSSD